MTDQTPVPIPTSIRKRGLVAAGAVATALVLSVGLTGCASGAVDEAAPPAASQEVEQPVVDETEVEAEVEEEAAESDLTLEQQQAVASAQNYLSVMAFSRPGLIDQLAYEGFSEDDATLAVDSLDVDWYEQAALSAQSYLDSSAFSRQGLIDQLLYEGFTAEQAEHGVTEVGF